MTIPPRYTLTDADVEAYLASKGEEESIGLCADPTECLIAQAIRAKYPEVSQAIVNDSAWLTTPTGTMCLVLTPLQQAMIDLFDGSTHADLKEPVTKRAFLAVWQRSYGGA